jgi:hypothetical protein
MILLFGFLEFNKTFTLGPPVIIAHGVYICWGGMIAVFLLLLNGVAVVKCSLKLIPVYALRQIVCFEKP